MKKILWVLPLLVLGLGCVERTLTLTSEPSGALVYLNGEEVGRTPLTRNFTWYGNYEVVLRKEGYQTVKTTTQVKAPWWQWVPIDLVAELVPGHLTDRQAFSYSMLPASTQPVDAQQMTKEGKGMQGLLESSEYTRVPKKAATQP